MMKNVTNSFNEFYMPQKALLIYALTGHEQEVYIESYDIGKQGNPINAHPLTQKETVALSSLLQQASSSLTDFLKPQSILPTQVLYLNGGAAGQVIWFTPAQKVNLYFAAALGIPCGVASVPPLIWKADRESLHVFAFKGAHRPQPATVLYHAPFFNIYIDGLVCMGTVNVAAEKCDCLETFIQTWENYFWKSYFSHLIGEVSPVEGSIIELWKELIGGEQPFPLNRLKKTSLRLENLLP